MAKRVLAEAADSALAAFVGVIVGAICALFGRVLLYVSNLRDAHLIYVLPLLPFVGLAIVYSYQSWGKACASGMALAFDRADGNVAKIDKRLVPLIMLSTWAGHLFGASVGREGVAVQIGACVSDALARESKRLLPKLGGFSARRFVLVGMAAGFAGLFGTPIAAVAFALEVMRPSRFEREHLLVAGIAAFCASTTSAHLGLEAFHAEVGSVVLSYTTCLALVVLGVAEGLVGKLFAELLARSKAYATKYFTNPYIKMLVLASCACILLYLVGNGRYTGLGTNLIAAATVGATIYPIDFALKLLFTIVCLAAGFQGGEVTPLFAIGASLGAVLGPVFGLDASMCAAIGYAALFGAATNTCFAPLFIMLEVFGPQLFVPGAIVLVFAIVVSGRSSIYPKRS